MGNDFYNYAAIDKIDATYKMIIGAKCNGKTYGWCRKVLQEYLQTGKKSVYIRRLDNQIELKMIGGLFNPHAAWLEKTTKGQWNGFLYRSHCFYLARFERLENGTLKMKSQDKNAFCHTFSLVHPEKGIGALGGDIAQICFDEFITQEMEYLNNEFFVFKKLIGFILDDRNDVPIYMLANPIDMNCPYFKEMNLSGLTHQPNRTIYVYQIGKSNIKLACDFCS